MFEIVLVLMSLAGGFFCRLSIIPILFFYNLLFKKNDY